MIRRAQRLKPRFAGACQGVTNRIFSQFRRLANDCSNRFRATFSEGNPTSTQRSTAFGQDLSTLVEVM